MTNPLMTAKSARTAVELAFKKEDHIKEVCELINKEIQEAIDFQQCGLILPTYIIDKIKEYLITDDMYNIFKTRGYEVNNMNSTGEFSWYTGTVRIDWDDPTDKKE